MYCLHPDIIAIVHVCCVFEIQTHNSEIRTSVIFLNLRCLHDFALIVFEKDTISRKWLLTSQKFLSIMGFKKLLY